jgi:biotin synthase
VHIFASSQLNANNLVDKLLPSNMILKKIKLRIVMTEIEIRNDWSPSEVSELYSLPLMDLLFRAHSVHRSCFDPNTVQTSTLISIKTGACPEDCAYCPQSARYKTGIKIEKLLPLEKILEFAKRAQANGATRFCMGAAWRNPKAKDLAKVVEMIRAVKELGLQTCVTLGMLTKEQALSLKEAGLDYYNHNIDTSADYYNEIITTRNFEDRITTLAHIREADIKVCCGGIVGMGEARQHRIGLLTSLANLPNHPQSVPINLLARATGTPLEKAPDFDKIEFVRTIAIARILMPKSYVRLSAGRTSMSEEMHALCFFAGANSIHFGEEKLFITANPSVNEDLELLQKLGMKTLQQAEMAAQNA